MKLAQPNFHGEPKPGGWLEGGCPPNEDELIPAASAWKQPVALLSQCWLGVGFSKEDFRGGMGTGGVLAIRVQSPQVGTSPCRGFLALSF